MIEKIVRCAVIGVIFIGCISLQGITDQRETQQIIFMLAMISIFGLLIRNLWITLFIGWTVFLFSFFKFTSGGAYLSNILFGSILYYITKTNFKKEHINFFINGFLWFVCLNIAYSVFQVTGNDFIFNHMHQIDGIIHWETNYLPNGFMGHKSIMASLIALAIPMVATRGSKWSWVAALGLFIPLYLAKTSLCFLVGFIGLLFVLFYKIPRKLWIGVIILSILSGCLYISKVDKLGTERFAQWNRVLKDCSIHPITGWGLDSFSNVTPMKDFRYSHNVKKGLVRLDTDNKEYNITEIYWWGNPHNLYISILFEFGVVGLFIFMGYMRQNVMRYAYAVKNSNTIALGGFVLAFLLISMGHFPIHLARMAVFIIPAFALLEISTQ